MAFKGTKAEVFPAVRYKALDYVFEAHSTVKVMKNLLTLPAPYLSGTADPLLATLAEESLRTPWTRGNWSSECGLEGSSVDELRGRTPADWLEKFDVLEEAEIIPSSNPGSPRPPDRDELRHILNISESEDPCQESFTTSSTSEQKRDDLRLSDDIMVVDPLPRFREHLPCLKALMSRLKTLPVVDPLLSRSSDTEELTLRHCEVYETSQSEIIQTPPSFQEAFPREPTHYCEELLIPDVVFKSKVILENCVELSKVIEELKAAPEEYDKNPLVLELLQPDEPEDIFKFEPPELTGEEPLTDQHVDTEVKGHLLLPSDLELDVIVTPPASPPQTHLSTSDLLTEHMSPVRQLCLLSASARRGKERRVWTAEKHLKFVLHFLFAEPDMDGETVEFCPLSEALKLNIERENIEELQMELWGSSVEVTEKFNSEGQSVQTEQVDETFLHMPLHAEDSSILTKSSHEFKSQTSAALESFRPVTIHPDRTSPASTAVNQTSSQVVPEVSETRSTPRTISSGVTLKKNPKLQDHLSTFMMLRSQLKSSVTDISVGTASTQKHTVQSEQPVLQEKIVNLEKVPSFLNSIVAGNASRESVEAAQVTAAPSASQQSAQELKPDSHVVQVQASASQRRAYQELLTFARPRLTAAKELGLNPPSWRDFGSLSPDQTRFVLKQHELTLRRTRSQDVFRDQLQLFNQVALIHVLVAVKDLLLQCDLGTALEYLVQAAETCRQQNLEQLVKKLKIVRHVHRQESDTKVQQLQQMIRTRMNDGDAHKILIIMSVDSDDIRSKVINSLSQVTSVMSVRPDQNRTKLLGAGLVSSVSDSRCVLVHEQHIGPDFPWSVFSLVLELDRPGLSPWTGVCREKNIRHLRFNTMTPDDVDPRRLEEEVPFVLMATDGLVTCPRLLQALESEFNVTVLERSFCRSLQMFGGTRFYSVVTVDQETAIVVQDLDELRQDGSSERVVMRLSALSLQYSCCWILLHRHQDQDQDQDQDGGLSSDAFAHLLLLFSSLMMFSLKPEDLDVKVLIADEVLDMARWIRRICFLSMMSRDGDPVVDLDRDWLSVTPSQEELSLTRFPSLTSLVAQSMLKRAPSFSWLMEASLPQMEKLLPEVPGKVLKLFCGSTSLHLAPAVPETPGTSSSFSPPGPESLGSDPSESTSFLFGPEESPGFFTPEKHVFGSRCSFSSPEASCSDPWRKEVRAEDLEELRWADPRRSSNDWTQTVSGDPTGFLDLSLDTREGHRSKDLRRKNSTSYGATCWMGGELKRRGDVSGLSSTGLLPVKSSRLSYERVPGRSDGQTRLRLL